jgi:outer membrane protein assembly factor BamB
MAIINSFVKFVQFVVKKWVVGEKTIKNFVLSVLKYHGVELGWLCVLFVLLLSGSLKLYSQDFEKLSYGKFKDVSVEIGTFLGNYERNYYGNEAPSRLDIIWEKFLGKGKTLVSPEEGKRTWFGCGWTGQPLLVREDEKYYLIQGAYDHNLKKLDANTGEIIWEYRFDDVIKGTGTLWLNKYAETIDESLVILQGSRRGLQKFLYSELIPSFRAISYFYGRELWELNVKRTPSYSRDVDASALIVNDTTYIGLENAIFTVLDPNPDSTITKDGILQPKVYQELPLYDERDIRRHRGNLVIESSPSLLNNHIYISAGSGHVYGYNLKTKEIDWDFYIGADLDGTPVVTEDSCLLVPVEKQYIEGKGGVFKLDPKKSESEAVVWYFPTGNVTFGKWDGGVIGSVGINDRTRPQSHPPLAAFIGIDGYLYVVNYKEIDEEKGKVYGPDNRKTYPLPKLVFKKRIGASISTPIIVEDKLIAAGYGGIHLFEFDENGNFKLLDEKCPGSFEATPIAWGGKIYIGSRNGYLYCFGEAEDTAKTTNENNIERNNKLHE